MKKILFLLMFLLIIGGCNNQEEIKKDEYKYEPTIIDATINYMCYDEYDEELVGTECVYKVEIPAPFRYSCPSGYNVYGSRCKYSVSTPDSSYCGFNKSYMLGECYDMLYADFEYYCNDGGVLYGSTCVYEYSYEAYVEYTCPYGFELINNKCYK